MSHYIRDLETRNKPQSLRYSDDAVDWQQTVGKQMLVSVPPAGLVEQHAVVHFHKDVHAELGRIEQRI